MTPEEQVEALRIAEMNKDSKQLPVRVLARAYLALLTQQSQERAERDAYRERESEVNVERQRQEVRAIEAERELDRAVEREEHGPLAEFARFILALDDPRAIELRRSISLTEIIGRAESALRASLAASPGKGAEGEPADG